MENLQFYEDVVATIPEVTRKGKTMPYTSLNGHMFSFLDKVGSMGLRLSTQEREHFIGEFDSCLMEQHGRTMKEYVVVPQTLLEDTRTLEIYFRQSFEYVKSLKPKPTKQKK